MKPYDYPQSPHQRRHGPTGYRNYAEFKPWLRDEFTFRCVYCLNRERWARGRNTFVVDHLLPKVRHPDLELEYTNLLYVCSTCNSVKGAVDGFPDPCAVAFGQSMRVNADGSIEALNGAGAEVIEILRLNNEENVAWRQLVLEIVTLEEERCPNGRTRFLAYPDDLPDLALLKPPTGNNIPGGVEQSFFARKKQGELPEAY